MLKATPIQIDDGRFLASHGRAAMFSEPGTGKTLTAIEAYLATKTEGRLLVSCPPIAERMWKANLERQLGAKVQSITNSNQTILPGADAVVVTYDRGRTMVGELSGKFKAAILDESDELKTLSSARTAGYYGTRASMKNAVLSGIDYIWPLTGTPIRRYADDLYPQLKALHPAELRELLGITSLASFRATFCVTRMRAFHPRQPPKETVIANKNEHLLREFIYETATVARRRLLADIAQYLPELVESEVMVPYIDSQELRDASGEAAAALSAGEDQKEAVLATARRLLGAAKAKSVADYAHNVIQGLTCPILLFFWHQSVGDILEQELTARGYTVGRIDGKTSVKKKGDLEDAFNAGNLDFLLGQIESMGVSLNLQEGSHYTIFAERDWSPASQQQAIARVLRMGQKHKVVATYCVADHMADEALGSVNDRKLKSTLKIIG